MLTYSCREGVTIRWEYVFTLQDTSGVKGGVCREPSSVSV